MSNEDIRWKQRFDNFTKALLQLQELIEKPELNKFERQGLIHCFEYTFELACKTIKEYLEYQGFSIKSTRMAIQTGFQTKLLKNGLVWIDAVEKRNLMAHTFNDTSANEAEQHIRTTYYGMLEELYQYFSAM